MKNIYSYLQATPTPNLYDYCCNYIESAHTGEGEMTANEKIYNLCVDYITGVKLSKNNHQYLNKLFILY